MHPDYVPQSGEGPEHAGSFRVIFAQPSRRPARACARFRSERLAHRVDRRVQHEVLIRGER